MQVQPVSSGEAPELFELLQLPGPALNLVLQQLDQCSLACLAVTCSTLRHAVPAIISKIAVRYSSPDTGGFDKWVGHHKTSLTNLTQCRITNNLSNYAAVSTCGLPVPGLQLRELRLERLVVQLGPAFGYQPHPGPGVLHGCSDLTALDLQQCNSDTATAAAAAAAIISLQKLQRLRLAGTSFGMSLGNAYALLAKLQYPSQLTHLSLECDMYPLWELPTGHTELSQLSRLTNLMHLKLGWLSSDVLGGLPSQLVKLTCLDFGTSGKIAAQLQHLSCLTALQELSVRGSSMTAGHLSGMQQLSQLTKLEVDGDFEFSTSSTQSWGCLTALQSLDLRRCNVQPEALLRLTQLQTLAVHFDRIFRPSPLGQLLIAVSQMSQLTEVQLEMESGPRSDEGRVCDDPLAAAAFTSLAASSKLRSLTLAFASEEASDGCALFTPGVMCPSLRSVSLRRIFGVGELHNKVHIIDEQQLQQMCSCCPGIESLQFDMWQYCSATPLLPLLQLSQLTRLHMCSVGSAVYKVVRAAAQLTGLRDLTLSDVPDRTRSANSVLSLTLTTLTNLQALKLQFLRLYPWHVPIENIQQRNKACWFRPSDVWVQLEKHLSAS